MSIFRTTTYLSEIIEESNKNPVVIFKYSSECNTSSDLAKRIEEKIGNKKPKGRIYKVTVQTEPVLSDKISEWFGIKHESPQIIFIKKGKVEYTAHHKDIKIEKFITK